jgi:aminoglycoside phosphotransferase (APT) family kinase protein
VNHQGWDNRTFRLGDKFAVRLPSAEAYVAQVEKEQYWLPRLAPLLPLPIPTPVAQGRPTPDYPWPWSVYRWLPGTPAAEAVISDLPSFANDLGNFLRALYQPDPSGGPAPGPHNFMRGGSLTTYHDETLRAIQALKDQIDYKTAMAVWDAAMNAEWTGIPVWLHGDVAAGNLLVQKGRLSAVIDFGTSAVGDPAGDLTIAWTFLNSASRQHFAAAVDQDSGTWARGRGWALWKALILIAWPGDPNTWESRRARQTLDAVLGSPVGPE